MPIDLYYMAVSPPCRAVTMAASALGVELNLKFLDLYKGEHMTTEFVKLTPQHCVPTMVDNDFVLCESRAIICYLADKYGKDDSLYPKDPKKRAIVNHRLFFEAACMSQRYADYYAPILYQGKEGDPAKLKRFEDAFVMLDKYPEGHTWAAGDHITIADFPLIAIISSAEIFGFDITRYPNVSRWLANAKKSIPNYEELNHAGCLEYKKVMDAKIILF
uniref:Glutathione S transferase class theta variant 1 n=1 Tax=Periplaneta americana TaxID=6978 RepID=G8XWU5_PERAM|nr:glutathione S transferase class theta variant 1 [Periplaneta americana]